MWNELEGAYSWMDALTGLDLLECGKSAKKIVLDLP